MLFRICLAVIFACTWITLSPRAATADTNVLFIVDGSGSMKKKLASGDTRMDAAKAAMRDTLASIPGEVRLGLLLYGHRKAKDCTDIELVSPIGADDAATIAQRIDNLVAKGETPIADSLMQALRSFAALKGQDNRIILVTDGIEECQGDPCAAAAAIRDAGLDLKVDLVGFTLTEAQRALMQCVPETTGGQYYDAQDVSGLTAALTQVQQTVAPAAPVSQIQIQQRPERFNLISVKNGGQILTTPSDVWLATNDGEENAQTWMRSGQEAVYAFEDRRSATFDSFGVLINEADNGNPKEIEILAGDEGPTGQFRAIGICAFQNVKMQQAPYQECQMPPVTARYLKVKLVSNHGGDGYVRATEFQLMGSLVADDGGAAAAAAPAGINLLSPRNGGAILSTPSDVWLATNDDQETNVTWLRAGEEAVYGFAEGRPATFEAFGMLVMQADNGVAREIELLAGDDGPTGQFRSVTTCSFQNIKILEDPYQLCRFPPVTARHLKVKMVMNHGGDGYLIASEFQLWGKVDENAGGDVAAAAHAPTGINLLSPQSGGQILAIPNDVWLHTADDQEEGRTWMLAGQEGVYAFAEGKSATFDTFGVLVPAANNGNPKEIELLAGDDGPTGQFRSIGTCSFQNVKLSQSPYQLCALPPTSARYLKIKLLSNQGGDGYIAATEFQLWGDIDAGSAPAAAAADASAGMVNLLSSGQGGALLMAPNDVWLNTADDRESQHTWLRANEEAVYAFAGEKAATFDTFAVLVTEAGNGNPKEIEILAGDEGPTGQFRSIATCTFNNIRIVTQPYQSCTFAPVTARYLKVRLVSNHGQDGYFVATEFKLYGTPSP
ncbi:Sad1/UNC-like protein [Dongia mobilis]|uniref:Sad1/UNC-like protein n=1 Tax=Dongia mobilis TaxID=578943 RepID=A0A4R6WS46_9PROT|nr:VWA domain-containing protein [Dongia mobilis]TDQ84336.1 Sad1/UNC-like protein [Dongia mobilis]